VTSLHPIHPPGQHRHRRVQQSLHGRRVNLDAAHGQFDCDAAAVAVHDQDLAVADAVAVEMDLFGHDSTVRLSRKPVRVCVHADRNRTESQLVTEGY
jgi:hypothetical protein